MRLITPFLLLPLVCGSCVHQASKPPTTQPLAFPQDLPELPNFSRVSDALYRGAQPGPEGFQRLKAMGIKTIVDLRGASHRDELSDFDFKSVHLPTNVFQIEDAKVIEFLRTVRDPANQPVFVHCERGADRTGCYVAAYRMVEQGWAESDAEAELPNFHYSPFFGNIRTYLQNLNVEQFREQLNTQRTHTKDREGSEKR